MLHSDRRAKVNNIAVVGAGTMGYGIALSFAMGGKDVSLYDFDEEMLETARANINTGIDAFIKEGHINDRNAVLNRLHYERSFTTTVDSVDMVIEAVPEKMTIKKDVFAKLDTDVREYTILATNTSGLSITEIASVIDDPSRVVGTHYFNPAHIVPLVEIVRGDRTADWVVNELYDLFEAINKTPVVVKEDIPGFISNRIQLAMIYEAESLLNQGIASAKDIDRAVKASFGFRLPSQGIFEKTDHAGLDVHLDVMSNLIQELDRGTSPQRVLQELVEQGDYGLKTGKGFYDWSGKNPQTVIQERDEKLLAQLETYRQWNFSNSAPTRGD